LRLLVRVYPEDGQEKVFYPDMSQRNDVGNWDNSLKRCVDVIGSLAAIVLFSPLFVVIAILVKCTSRGPMLFCAKRVGRYGKEFCFYKFRTMVVDNDPDIHRQFVKRLIAGEPDVAVDGGLYKLKKDPRVTPIGRFLRRTSLDELPQFFNVLLNDMSLVGPRPPLPYEYCNYRDWHKRRVLEQKPGITGLWQVRGRSRTTFDEMVRMDIQYALHRTVWSDLKIMLLTPAAMFSGRGAC
jgi:lipopolysaccharide/colanic/teichoic acid biosynthesis glycosyltransferase